MCNSTALKCVTVLYYTPIIQNCKYFLLPFIYILLHSKFQERPNRSKSDADHSDSWPYSSIMNQNVKNVKKFKCFYGNFLLRYSKSGRKTIFRPLINFIYNLIYYFLYIINKSLFLSKLITLLFSIFFNALSYLRNKIPKTPHSQSQQCGANSCRTYP